MLITDFIYIIVFSPPQVSIILPNIGVKKFAKHGCNVLGDMGLNVYAQNKW
jgi:hypothetical protein